MTIFQVLEVVGVPSIFAISVYTIRSLIKLAKQIDILQKAQKAQMRSQLLKDYEVYKSRTYVRPLELDEWINQWQSYHELVGNNSVLESRKAELLSMPCHD